MKVSANPGMSFFSANLVPVALASLSLAASALAGLTPLTAVHPDWTRINLRAGGAASLQPMVSGIDFLSDGRMVVAHWGGTHNGVTGRQMNGRVYILSGVTGNSPSPAVTTFATGLEDVMGLAVVSDRIYVSGGERLLELLDANGDGVSDGTRTVYTHPGAHARAEFMYGILHRSGTFYLAPSSANLQTTPADQQSNPNRGVVISVNAATGASQIIAMGFRQQSGLEFGPNGDLFTADVAGNWVPTCKLIHIQQGRYYGFKHTPRETWDNMTETPPAVYMPDDGITYAMGASPGNPLYLTTAPYAGQFLMGDIRYGGIQRYFLERVNNQYQGAVFQFTGGLESGVFRLALGPDGMLYAGMLGESGDWNWNGQYYGLQKLRYNNTTNAYEMLAVRSRPGGLEIEFNKPFGTTATTASSYNVQSFYFTATVNYDNPPQGLRTDAVGTIQACADGRRAFLPIANFSAGRVYRVLINSTSTFRAADNSTIWTRETLYANNAVGSGAPCDPVTAVDPQVAKAALLEALQWTVEGGKLVVRSPFRGPHAIRIRDLRGSLVTASAGTGTQTHSFELSDLRGRFAVIEAEGDGEKLRRTVELP